MNANKAPEDASLADHAQPLVSHLIELRDRLLRCLMVIALAFFPLYYFANDLYEIVSAPIRSVLPEGTSMIATEIASPFMTPLKLALVAAFFVSIPFILFQLWRFIAPALYRKEKQLALPILISSIVLFYIGMAFAYFLVFPLVFGFLTHAGPETAVVMPDISSYLNFVLTMFFAFGITFEIPVATVILVATGVVSTASLIEKRPYIIVGCFVVGMILTPPDIMSQFLLAMPMWGLFEIGVLCARLIEKRQPPAESDTATADAP